MKGQNLIIIIIIIIIINTTTIIIICIFMFSSFLPLIFIIYLIYLLVYFFTFPPISFLSSLIVDLFYEAANKFVTKSGNEYWNLQKSQSLGECSGQCPQCKVHMS